MDNKMTEQKVESRLANLGQSLEYMNKPLMAKVAFEGFDQIVRLRNENATQAETIAKLREALNIALIQLGEELSGKENRVINLFKQEKAAEKALTVLSETEGK